MKGEFIGFITFLIVILSVGFVFAATGENAAVTEGATGQITEGPLLPGNATAQGGNVTRVDLETNASTSKWQGFYGNVSGNLLLGLNADVLYDFGSSQVISVYAARDPSFDFANIENTTAAQVDTAFGFNTAADVDQAVDIFTSQITIDGVTNANATALEDGNFNCYLVDDGNNVVVNDFAFGGEVQNSGAVGFNSATWQYELLVPIDAGTPDYYFFMSI